MTRSDADHTAEPNSGAPPPSPWPDRADDVAFLCHTTTPESWRLLTDWIRRTDPRPRGADKPRIVRVSDPGDAPVDDGTLADVLAGSEATLLTPLRLAWQPSRQTVRSTPRLRDLVLGDPRTSTSRFGTFLQLHRAEQFRPLAGASATVGELRARHLDVVSWQGEDPDELDSFVLRQASIVLDVAERELQGRRYKVPRLVVAGLEGSRGYQRSLTSLAAKVGRPVEAVRAEARTYLEEMVASPSMFFIDWVGTVTRWIVSLGYRQIIVDPDDVERARTIMRDKPTALLWTHKSHVDAIALLSVMYDHDFPAPHSMGGLNMAFVGVGYAGRRSGTVFIRRQFSDNPVYKVALQQYLGYLMEKRFPLSWSLEGTRSRSGKLGRPRYGLLKYALESAHATRTEDVHLIPVAINYDLIGETVDYAREEAGEAKSAESLGWFMDYLRRLRSPMGNIYLDFGEPVVLEGPAPEITPELLQDVAFEVARRVNERAPVTLPALMCMTLLGSTPRALTYRELNVSMLQLLAWLGDHRVRLTDALATEDLPELEDLATNVFATGIIERVVEGDQTLYSIGSGQHATASYYRNTIVHHFADRAIVEVALRMVADVDAGEREDALLREAKWLRDLTGHEFYHPPIEGLPALIETELGAVDADWRATLSGSRSDVIRLLRDLTPLVSHATLLPVLEAYATVTRVASELPVGREVDKDAVVSAALSRGRSRLRRARLSSAASIGKTLYAGAYAYLADSDLLGIDESALRARRDVATHVDEAVRAVQNIAELAQDQLTQAVREASGEET